LKKKPLHNGRRTWIFYQNVVVLSTSSSFFNGIVFVGGGWISLFSLFAQKINQNNNANNIRNILHNFLYNIDADSICHDLNGFL